VDYPNSVASIAGRRQFKDDWQFYDPISTSFAYDDAMISWGGKCRNGMTYYGRDHGAAIIGTTGTVVVDRDGYEIYADDPMPGVTSSFAYMRGVLAGMGYAIHA
jgi:hypothetical protein